MIIRFDKKLFILLSLAFIIAAIIGTLSHEFGHYIVAKGLGYKASIHYAHTSLDGGLSESSNNRVLILSGGPLQTILMGMIGLLLLELRKRSFKTKARLTRGQWVLIFITLFWLRQTANLFVWLGDYLLTKQFSYSMDEIRIALELGLPFWSLAAITGLTGLVILCIVIFKFIPTPQRQTFILSGIIGGVTGYILWLYLLGPVLLP
ncbi:MAG: M50 family metallopeptidase [Chitinophagales bacterium]